jgi:hypothetical protein
MNLYRQQFTKANSDLPDQCTTVFGAMRNRAVFNTLFFVLIVVIWNNQAFLTATFDSTMMRVCLLFYIGSFLYINRDSVPVNPCFLLIALLLTGISRGLKKFPICGIASSHLVEKRAMSLKRFSSKNLKRQRSILD